MKARIGSIMNITKKKMGIVILCIVLIAAVITVGYMFSRARAEESEQPSTVPDYIQEYKEIYPVMEKAEEAYAWFTGYGEIELDTSMKYFDNDSVWYGVVTHEGISTMEELEEYLSAMFDEATCQKLISTCAGGNEDVPLFMERDGVLYCAAGVVGLIQYNDCDWTLGIKTADEESARIVANWSMTVWDVALNGSYEMNCIKGDDGIWRFTDFVMPVQAAVAAYDGREANNNPNVSSNPTSEQITIAYAAAQQALSMYKAVLLGNTEFFETGIKETLYINQLNQAVSSDSKFTAKTIKFAVVDLNNDGTPEVILWLRVNGDDYYGFEVLCYQDEVVYGYDLPYRTFNQLKADGTFYFSSSAMNSGIGTLRFGEGAYSTFKAAYREANYDIDGNPVISYIVNDEIATQKEFDAVFNKQDEKPDAVWYDFTDDNIEAMFPDSEASDIGAISADELKSISNGGLVSLTDDSPAAIWWIPKSQDATLSEITSWLEQAKIYNGEIPSSQTSSDTVFSANIGPSILYINTSDQQTITIQPAFYLVADGNGYKKNYLSDVLVFNDGKQVINIQSSQLYDWLKNNLWKSEFEMKS